MSWTEPKCITKLHCCTLTEKGYKVLEDWIRDSLRDIHYVTYPARPGCDQGLLISETGLTDYKIVSSVKRCTCSVVLFNYGSHGNGMLSRHLSNRKHIRGEITPLVCPAIAERHASARI